MVLTWGGDALEVVVADDGRGAQADREHEDVAHAGMGLRGMRERVEAVGGRLEVRRDDGWAVVATLPTAPGAAGEMS